MSCTEQELSILIDLRLNQLDPEQAKVWQQRLRVDPTLADAYLRCSNLLAPLETLAREPISLPKGLSASTLEQIRSELPPTVPVVPSRHSSSSRSEPDGLVNRMRSGVSFLRPEWFAAAVSLVVVVGLCLGALSKLRQEQQLLACQEELRALHFALIGYADTHAGRLPEIGTAHFPRPGTLAAALAKQGQLETDRKFLCPLTYNLESLKDDQLSFAYTLGYRPNRLSPAQGVRLSSRAAHDNLPIAADHRELMKLISVNDTHEGGQNVLHLGGHVRFLLGTKVGPHQDDIYENHDGLRRAGVHPADVCLGGPHDLP